MKQVILRTIKYRLSILPALCLLLILTGCSSAGASQPGGSSAVSSASAAAAAAASSTGSSKTGKAKDTLSLPYVLGKSLNPLTTDSMTNLDLAPLLYDCLARPDENYSPVRVLASSISSSGATVTVTLRQGVRFTDGTSLTAKDVQYSYGLAKATAASYYYTRTTNIAQINTQGSYTVVFTLSSPDPLFANLLDIPIIKSGTGNQPIPVGSGMYSLPARTGTVKLRRNTGWYGGQASSIRTVTLVNIPDKDMLISSLEIGDIDYLRSDYGSGAYSGSNTAVRRVNLNQLVFIGVNSAKAPLNNNNMRKAISCAIDRNTLKIENFSGHTTPVVLPFNPSLKGLTVTPEAAFAARTDAAAAALSAAGYNKKTVFTLLVNKDNAVRAAAAGSIAANLQKAGISVSVEQVPFADYSSRIAKGDFDLYLGEIKLGADMDLSPFFAAGGHASYGMVQGSRSYAEFTAWRNGTATLKQVTDTFADEMPFIPVCYRSGSVSYRTGLSGVSTVEDDIFFNFEKWHFTS